MVSLSKALIGTVMGASVLAFSAMTASAAVVCTGNTCWHATEKYDYPARCEAEAGVSIPQ